MHNKCLSPAFVNKNNIFPFRFDVRQLQHLDKVQISRRISTELCFWMKTHVLYIISRVILFYTRLYAKH